MRCLKRPSSGIRFLAILLLAWLMPPLAEAAQFPAKPAAENFHVDRAGLLRPADAESIDRIAAELLAEQGVALLVVTINSRVEQRAAPMSIERYAQALFDHWGIGIHGYDSGILLLVSRGDREARIAFGRAWAGRHDEDADYIMQQLILPAFRTGDYSTGILAGVEGLNAIARGLDLPRPKAPAWLLPALLLGLVLGVAGAISLWRGGRKGWAFALLMLLAALVAAIVFMQRKQGSGGAFGGGRSGGGGATGRW